MHNAAHRRAPAVRGGGGGGLIHKHLAYACALRATTIVRVRTMLAAATYTGRATSQWRNDAINHPAVFGLLAAAEEA